MASVITQLFLALLPIYQDISAKWKAAHNGAEPTDEQMAAKFEQDYAQILGEGQDWKNRHPKSTQG